MAHRAPSRSRVASAAAALVLGLLVAGTMAQVQANCKGVQKYKLTIYMSWTRVTDKSIPRNASVPQVVAVSHTDEWKLYEPTQKLAPYAKTFIQGQKLRPLFNQLDKYIDEEVVAGYDYITKASPTNVLRMNVRLNGDIGATKISVMGLVHPTPDWFFGASAIEMCTGTKFADRYPLSKDVKVLWMQSLDAGLDDRDSILEIPKPVDEIVTVDGRIDLVGGYAQFELEKGSFSGQFQFWKILVIVGCLAIVVLVTFICLYPRCCKKQMLDVPVPLQDESQWRT